MVKISTLTVISGALLYSKGRGRRASAAAVMIIISAQKGLQFIPGNKLVPENLQGGTS